MTVALAACIFVRMLAEQGGCRQRWRGLPELWHQPPTLAVGAVTGDTSASRHSYMHAPAEERYGPAGRARRGEIDSLAVAFKLGRPIGAVGHWAGTEQKPRRDQRNDQNQHYAAESDGATGKGAWSLGQSGILSKRFGR